MNEEQLIEMCRADHHYHDRVLVGSGDDCAVLAHADGRSVISTDVLVEGVHFRRGWMGGETIGRRVAAQNIADIAAMGARLNAAVVAVVFPDDFEPQELHALSRGMAKTLEAAGGALVGGDLSRGSQLTIACTVVGDLEGRPPVLRSGAKEGDKVALAGQIGWSAAGYQILHRGVGASIAPAQVRRSFDRAVSSFRVPTVPWEAGILAGKAGANAMLDVSDGLSLDAGRIAKDSHVGINLDRSLLMPFVAQLQGLADYLQCDPWQWVLGGGEDHPLLATFSGEVPEPFQVVGQVVSAPSEGEAVSVSGNAISPLGWDHFRS